MVRQELTGSRVTDWPGKPHPEQGRIEGRLRGSADVLGLAA